MAKVINGYVMSYECTDVGTGNPCMSLWGFDVCVPSASPPIVHVITTNHFISETMRFGIETNNKVKVTYDPTSFVISLAQVYFEYICEARTYQPCTEEQGPPNRPPDPEHPTICTTTRISRCDPNGLCKDESGGRRGQKKKKKSSAR